MHIHYHVNIGDISDILSFLGKFKQRSFWTPNGFMVSSSRWTPLTQLNSIYVYSLDGLYNWSCCFGKPNMGLTLDNNTLRGVGCCHPDSLPLDSLKIWVSLRLTALFFTELYIICPLAFFRWVTFVKTAFGITVWAEKNSKQAIFVSKTRTKAIQI